MKKPLVPAFLAVATAAVANPTISLSAPDATVVRPASGYVTYDFVGTVVADAGTTIGQQTVDFPYPAGGGGTLFVSFPSNGPTGLATFTGTLFSITVFSTVAPGYYGYRLNGPPDRSDYTVYDTAGFVGVPYSVTVVAQPTPEPAPLAAFGLGAAVLLRRRKRAWVPEAGSSGPRGRPPADEVSAQPPRADA